MPSILANHPGAQKFLVLYGTNDAIHNVFSGFGLNPGDGGYTGSFKDNMNKIIKTIINADKEPILAKVPMALGPCSTCAPFSNPYTAFINQVTISQYNQVIEGLALDNGLPVPPDLYNELPHNEYTDNIHPDGAGYDTIATLWSEQL
jgi:lysophospholipase L1-like esterase